MHRVLVASIKGSLQRLYSNCPRAKNQSSESIYGTCGFPEPSQAAGGMEKETKDQSKLKPKHVGLREELVERMETKSATSVNCLPIVSQAQERLFRAQATQGVYLMGIIETLVQKCSENSTKGPLSFLERMLREF